MGVFPGDKTCKYDDFLLFFSMSTENFIDWLHFHSAKRK